MKMKYVVVAIALGLASCASEPAEMDAMNDALEQLQDAAEDLENLEDLQEAATEEATLEEADNAAEENTTTGGDDIDAMLDDYEDFMDDYIDLMKKAQAGDLSAMSESADVMSKAEKFGQSLAEVQGTMSPEQVARYTEIAMKATSALGQ